MNVYKLRERYDRAKSQDIQILSSAPDFFVVKGSTGDHYNVWLEDNGVFCTCKDAEMASRHKIPLCKHRMLVLIHGFYMDWDDICHLAEQMFSGSKFDPLRAPPGVTCVDPRETDSCVICLEDLNTGQASKKVANLTLTKGFHPFCKAQCGTAFHEPCIKGWLAKHSTCPMCRSRWIWS